MPRGGDARDLASKKSPDGRRKDLESDDAQLAILRHQVAWQLFVFLDVKVQLNPPKQVRETRCEQGRYGAHYLSLSDYTLATLSLIPNQTFPLPSVYTTVFRKQRTPGETRCCIHACQDT